MAYPKHDDEYRTVKITKVDNWGDQGGSVTFDDGWSLWIPVGPFKPESGMAVRMYGKGIGYNVRGIFIDGHEFRYRTEAQAAQDHADWVAQRQREAQANLEAEVDERDRQWAALPEIYQQRKARFMTNNPEWRREYEPYELFVCEQAHLIATTLKTSAAIAEFHKADWEEQLRRVLGLSRDHSGNTLGAACKLAQFELVLPEGVVQQHGALSPLVGSKAYGDMTPEEHVAEIVMDEEK